MMTTTNETANGNDEESQPLFTDRQVRRIFADSKEFQYQLLGWCDDESTVAQYAKQVY